MNSFNLERHQLTVAEVHRNLPPSALYEHAIRFEKDASIAENGALVAYSGVKTGRSPGDKRVVKHPDSEKNVWWGKVNIPCDAQTFALNRQRALDYLNTRERLYCFDGFAGWDPKYRIKVRVICSRPYHALFMHTMLIRPTPDELASFGKPDFTIYNAGAFPANRLTIGVGSTTSVALRLEERELVSLGTQSPDRHRWGDQHLASVLPGMAPELAGGRVIVAHLGSGASLCEQRTRGAAGCRLFRLSRRKGDRRAGGGAGRR
jgi:phosphoenolpyruvate carboxykinase (ATP)